VNIVALYILPMKEIAGNTFVLGSVADRVFGSLGDPIIRFDHGDFHAELPECQSAFLFADVHAMSCDGLFFRPRLEGERGRDADSSLLLSTIVGVLFVLIAFS